MSVLSVFAAELAAAGGAVARRRFYSTRYKVGKKAGGEIVTEVDREVEELIATRIAEKYPDHGVLGEESGARGNQDKCWVIDPIDGTTNFVHQFEYCAVSVAFCENGRATAGAVHHITANETYVAAKGEGAFAENRRLRHSGATSLGKSLIISSGVMNDSLWQLMHELSSRVDGTRRGGATALDLAMVAAGRADAMISGPVRFWDVAAGALLAREAGCLIADTEDNTSFAFGKPTGSFVVGAPGVFASCLSALKKRA